jgi:hypothetical protein
MNTQTVNALPSKILNAILRCAAPQSGHVIVRVPSYHDLTLDYRKESHTWPLEPLFSHNIITKFGYDNCHTLFWYLNRGKEDFVMTMCHTTSRVNMSVYKLHSASSSWL